MANQDYNLLVHHFQACVSIYTSRESLESEVSSLTLISSMIVERWIQKFQLFTMISQIYSLLLVYVLNLLNRNFWLYLKFVRLFIELQAYSILFVLVFDKMVGSIFRVRPNSDNHIFGTAFIEMIGARALQRSKLVRAEKRMWSVTLRMSLKTCMKH